MELENVQKKLGLGLRALARELGGSCAMCHYWKRIGRIPARRHDDIRALAKKMGVTL
jgi:hypothetical protein